MYYLIEMEVDEPGKIIQSDTHIVFLSKYLDTRFRDSEWTKVEHGDDSITFCRSPTQDNPWGDSVHVQIICGEPVNLSNAVSRSGHEGDSNG